MLLLRSTFVVLIILLGAGCVPHTSVRRSPEYEATINRSTNVSVLPPAAEVSTVDALSKKERMYEYESYLESLIGNEIAPAIEQKGFRVRVVRNHEIHNKKLSKSFLRLRSHYNEAREQLYSKALWEEKDAFAISKNVGSAAVEFGKKTNSDILVMIDYVGTTKTSGARALSVAADVFSSVLSGGRNISYNDSTAESAVMIVGIVNAKNGDILWTNMFSYSKGLFSSMADNLSLSEKVDKKGLNELISGVLDKLARKAAN